MRILVVTSQFPIAGDATRGRPIQQTVRELARLASVHVVSPIAMYPRWAQPKSYLFRAPDAAPPGSDGAADYRPYPALPMLSRPFNGWLCGRAIRAAARRFDADVVLAYWLYPDAYGAMQVARQLDIPLVAGARGSDIRVRDPLSRFLTRRVVRAASRLLVVSADLGHMAAGAYGADPARTRVIPNGCDAAIFHESNRAEARAALGVAEEAQLIVYVGRLVAEKGLRELLGAMTTLTAQRPRAELVLVGDGRLRDELTARAAAAGSRVRFAGAQTPPEVARWMAAANLVTLPSYSEGHPNVLVEALACGRPVVSTPVGGIPEVVDASCSILVPPRDADALALALAQTLDREWDAEALSLRFSRSWHTVAEDTLRACAEAVAERARIQR